MVLVNRFLEGTNLNVEYVKLSPTKKVVILDEFVFEELEFLGKKKTALTGTVQIDGIIKKWRMNKETVQNLKDKLSPDSRNWISCVVNVSVQIRTNRECIIGSLAVSKPVNATQKDEVFDFEYPA